MAQTEITQLEQKIGALTQELMALRLAAVATQIPNYTFTTLEGETSLLDLFAGADKLMMIHNMGQACRYCTLWGDGFNGFLPHLESAMSVVMVSKDSPKTQHLFANARGWRFRLASHGGGDYIREQSAEEGANNMPGVVVYERKDDKIFRKNCAVFGPGDLYCSMWNLLGLAGLGEEQWTPQYSYWQRPQKLEDGGENVLG